MDENSIYCGDCKVVLKEFPDECIDLIYIDPPFFSNKHYEVLWNDGYELRAFEDRWKGGINHYIEWMKDRMEECYRVLKKTGSLYLHCDWHASHYLKVMMDDILGRRNFRNEIVWHYGAKASQKYPAFQRKHDTILFFSKGKKFTFNRLLQEYSKATLAERKTRFKYEDEKGRYRLTTRRDSSGEKYRAKVYLHKGVFMDDVWDLPIINATSKERLGYPTQKPEALLERIINASSNPNDLVLDPMCGCGTTMVASHKLGRRFIGIDVSPTACKLMKKRMRRQFKVDIMIHGIPVTVKELKKIPPFEFQNWVCESLNARVHKKTGDMGIDGFTFEGIPIQVKQSEKIGRNVVDNFETALRRKNRDDGIIVAFSFGKGAIGEISRAKLEEGLDIQAITVSELLKEIDAKRVYARKPKVSTQARIRKNPIQKILN